MDTRSQSDLPLLIEPVGDAVWLILNRPGAANALSVDLVRALSAAVDTLAKGVLPCALVIGARGGRSFCAGADLKERMAMSQGETHAFLDAFGGLLTALERFPRPVIAALSGAAHGGGLELALACDLRVCADHATLGLPETRLAIIPGAGGTQRLARLVGVGVAKDLILTGRRVDARTALGMGLVSRVVSAKALDEEVDRMVGDLSSAGPLALTQAKKAIDGGFGLSLPEALAFERACYDIVLSSEDRNEGLRAFSEKRPPVYRGR
jgi:methylglutaconyl-CoA hydratase